jgi:hypothetical protein
MWIQIFLGSAHKVAWEFKFALDTIQSLNHIINILEVINSTKSLIAYKFYLKHVLISLI